MGAMIGSIGNLGGKISKTPAMPQAGAGQAGVAGQMMPALGGLAPGQAKLPGGAGGGPPTAMSNTPGVKPAMPTGGLQQALKQMPQQPGPQPGQPQGPQPAPPGGGAPATAQPPAVQPLPGVGGPMLGQSPQLTGFAALGKIAQNPRLDRYFGGKRPQTGVRSPWTTVQPLEKA